LQGVFVLVFKNQGAFNLKNRVLGVFDLLSYVF
jgi:hypothetical protein